MASAAETLREAPATGDNSGLMVTPHDGASEQRTESGAASRPGTFDGHRSTWPAIEWLPVQLSISLPIPRFRVRDLLVLDPGQILSTDWPNGDDLPLSADQVQLAWVEMESVEQEMAVRITRLL